VGKKIKLCGSGMSDVSNEGMYVTIFGRNSKKDKINERKRMS